MAVEVGKGSHALHVRTGLGQHEGRPGERPSVGGGQEVRAPSRTARCNSARTLGIGPADVELDEALQAAVTPRVEDVELGPESLRRGNPLSPSERFSGARLLVGGCAPARPESGLDRLLVACSDTFKAGAVSAKLVQQIEQQAAFPVGKFPGEV